MQWSKILRDRPERPVLIDSNGIAQDRGFAVAVAQVRDLKERERVASQYLASPELAVQEAGRHHSLKVMRRRARQVVEGLVGREHEPERVLVDLGAGFGWHWVELALEFSSLRFVLVDFAMANLLVCRTLMPFDQYPNVLCLQADVADLPLEDHSIDFCWSVQVHQHLPPDKRRAGFGELRRILKGDAQFYIGWVRSVPLVRLVYALWGKSYQETAQAPEGTYFQRFDESIYTELRAEFSHTHLTYSEALFHPDLLWSPRSNTIGTLDGWVAASCLAPLMARQVEVWGAQRASA